MAAKYRVGLMQPMNRMVDVLSNSAQEAIEFVSNRFGRKARLIGTTPQSRWSAEEHFEFCSTGLNDVVVDYHELTVYRAPLVKRYLVR